MPRTTATERLPRHRKTRKSPPATSLLTLLVSALLLAAGGCTDVTSTYPMSTDTLHNQRVLLLEAALLQPTPQPLHQQVQDKVRTALRESADVGEVLDGAELRNRPQVGLDTLNAYDQFANTLSLTGIADPELANQLHEALGVGLLAIVQPVFQPCETCDGGDQFFLVGQLVEAATGKLAFRTHIQAEAESEEPDALARQVDELTELYLEQQAFAFKLRPHRVRFNHLRRLADG